MQSNHAVSSERTFHQNSELTNSCSKYANCIDANKYNELYGDFTSCYIHTYKSLDGYGGFHVKRK